MNSEKDNLSSQAQLLVEALDRCISSNELDVPMLPEVANKALILAQSPDSDASEMTKLIQSDQSLAGHMMRIANSVAYTPLANLVSLQQAIARLGMGVISEIALTASVGAKFFDTPGFEAHVAFIWRHALATALWSKELAKQSRSNVEVAFLAGLLHSIGRPAVIQAVLDMAKKQGIELSEADVFQFEKIYGHQASQAVITSWEMPLLVIESVTYYKDYNNAPTTINQAAFVYGGAVLANHMLNPDQLSQEELTSSPVFATLNLYQDEIETLLNQTGNIKERLEGLQS